MRFDFISEPLSPSDPCGPDLDLEMDGEYGNYTLLASGRLPSRFFDNDGNPFDRSTIDLQAETKSIMALLKRTRDARLLSLDMRFNALRGELIGFCEGVQGLAILLTTFWQEFHPRPEDGDYMFRTNAVESIDDPIQVILPLQFAPIARGRGASVSLRNYLVATQKADPRGTEERMTPDNVLRVLSDSRDDTAYAQVAATYATLQATLLAIGEIRKAFLADSAAGGAPNLDRVVDVLTEIAKLIALARPDLVATSADEAGVEGAEGGEGAPSGRSVVTLGLIKSHTGATAALMAVENYFLRYEPSNPAMVLVRQARDLIGKPLVAALEALLPELTRQVAVYFDGSFSFEMDFPILKSVTNDIPPPEPAEEDPSTAEPEAEASAGTEIGEATAGADGEAVEGVPAIAPVAPEAPTKFHAGTRTAASDLMMATEAFFRSVEPSSPVPMLLAKARNYLNKDFVAILNEMIRTGR